ncbi:MAG: CPBP family intramembrane glutamic endopeptidase [Thermoanaerobaculia bacterium]|nr:CPBP family intramembrane glutamic endopeptidase [Thermoanaerobaculia bacterium]
MSETPRVRNLQAAVFVLAVFLVYWFLEDLLSLLPGYRGLFDRYEYWVPRSLRSAAEVALVLAAVCWLHRAGAAAGFRELGLRRPVLRPLALGLVAVAPMAVVFGWTHAFAPDPLPEILYLSLLSPLAEELVFRGFLFGQLWRTARWGMWPALLASSAAFGLGHALDADTLVEAAGLMGLTGLGAAIFAWLYARWGSLAAPIALHVLMNLCWGLWQVGDGALAGWVPFALQLTTVALAIGLTVVAGRRGWTRAPVSELGPGADQAVR